MASAAFWGGSSQTNAAIRNQPSNVFTSFAFFLRHQSNASRSRRHANAFQNRCITHVGSWLSLKRSGVGVAVLCPLLLMEMTESMANTTLFTQATFGQQMVTFSPAGRPQGVQAFLYTSGRWEKRPKWPSASGVHNNGLHPPKVCWGWLAFVLTGRWVRGEIYYMEGVEVLKVLFVCFFMSN